MQDNILKKQKTSLFFKKSLTILFLTIMALVVIIPFYWMINTSLKTPGEVQKEPPTLYPHEWTFDNYKVALLGKKHVEITNLNRQIKELETLTIPALEAEIVELEAKYNVAKPEHDRLIAEDKQYTTTYKDLKNDPNYVNYEDLRLEVQNTEFELLRDIDVYNSNKQTMERLAASGDTSSQEYNDAKAYVDAYEQKQADFEIKKQQLVDMEPQHDQISAQIQALEQANEHYTPEFYAVYQDVKKYEDCKLLLDNARNDLNVALPARLEAARNLSTDSFGKYLGNTLIVGIGSTILGTFMSIIGAFALSRLNFKGRELIFTIMLATMMIPGEMMVIANYITVSKLGWVDNGAFPGAPFLAMTIPFLVTVFHIYLLRQNFKQIPDEMYYAAKIDGTSDWKYLWRIMVPLAKSSIITITILKLMGSWNAYIWPNLVAGNDYKLITVWLRTSFNDMQTGRVLIEQQMAATVVVLLPLLLVFIFLRKYVMRGVSRGGIKG